MAAIDPTKAENDGTVQPRWIPLENNPDVGSNLVIHHSNLMIGV